MKKLLAVTAATAMMASTAFAGGHSNIKIGVILGFTGPIESLHRQWVTELNLP